MQENVGEVDRWVRVGIGGSLAVAALIRLRHAQLAPALMLAAGVMLLETSITRVCPINALLGIDTRRIRALLTSSTASDTKSAHNGSQDSDAPASNLGSAALAAGADQSWPNR